MSRTPANTPTGLSPHRYQHWQPQPKPDPQGPATTPCAHIPDHRGRENAKRCDGWAIQHLLIRYHLAHSRTRAIKCPDHNPNPNHDLPPPPNQTHTTNPQQTHRERNHPKNPTTPRPKKPTIDPLHCTRHPNPTVMKPTPARPHPQRENTASMTQIQSKAEKVTSAGKPLLRESQPGGVFIICIGIGASPKTVLLPVPLPQCFFLTRYHLASLNSTGGIQHLLIRYHLAHSKTRATPNLNHNQPIPDKKMSKLR